MAIFNSSKRIHFYYKKNYFWIQHYFSDSVIWYEISFIHSEKRSFLKPQKLNSKAITVAWSHNFLLWVTERSLHQRKNSLVNGKLYLCELNFYISMKLKPLLSLADTAAYLLVHIWYQIKKKKVKFTLLVHTLDLEFKFTIYIFHLK